MSRTLEEIAAALYAEDCTEHNPQERTQRADCFECVLYALAEAREAGKTLQPAPEPYPRPATPDHIQTVHATAEQVQAFNERPGWRWVIYFEAPGGARAQTLATLAPYPGIHCCQKHAEGLVCEHLGAELVAEIEKLRDEGAPAATAIGYTLDRLDRAPSPVEGAGARVVGALPDLPDPDALADQIAHQGVAPLTVPVKGDGARSAKVHTLKCWPEFFAALRDGRKRFELRRDDRGFSVGDRLVLQEWDPVTGRYTRECLSMRVTYVARGVFGLPDDLCVMSVKPWPAPSEPESGGTTPCPKCLGLGGFSPYGNPQTQDRYSIACSGCNGSGRVTAPSTTPEDDRE